MNLLLTTLGTSWSIVPELYGFTNPAALDVYAHSASRSEILSLREQQGIEPVDAIWVVTTEAMDMGRLERWAGLMCLPLTLWRTAGVEELASVAENRWMADLIYRVVFHARTLTQESGGRLYLSLAGGRKTMSAEMQQAGMVFGCDALLHVVDVDQGHKPDWLKRADNLTPELFVEPLPTDAADCFQPLVILGPCAPNAALAVEPAMRARDFPLTAEGGAVPGGTELYDQLRERLRQADNLIYHFSRQLSGADSQTNFHALYTLPPNRVRALREQRIGADPSRRAADLAWLEPLPKTDLHCHLGGLLSPEEMIRVAGSLEKELWVQSRDDHHPDFAAWRQGLRAAVQGGDLEEVLAQLPPGGIKGLRRWRLPEPYDVCAFLLAFEGHAKLLEHLIYAELLDQHPFKGIGIRRYEGLGDLQGSGLLQHEATLRAAVAVLREQMARDRIHYLELRCSPINYSRGGLPPGRVVEILLEALSEADRADIRLLFIASRHRSENEARQHVELAQHMCAESEPFRRRFVGFDLAGDEARLRPAEMRDTFRPLLEACIPITIHAGENQPVENIWEAAYELNADRIGHGLTLGDNLNLLQRFVERRIAVEMCPSSNDQIVGYDDALAGSRGGRAYPLAAYLAQGLRVTVNTDNPGISRTSPSAELYKAACLSPGGLTRWQILQLLRNGFQAAFCPLRERAQMLRQAEQALLDWLAQPESWR